MNMKILRSAMAALMLAASMFAADAQRQTTVLSDGWTVKPMTRPQRGVQPAPVELPHTWNSTYLRGTEYNRESMAYQRTLSVSPQMLRSNRVFLYFEGVNSVANVFVNHVSAGTHKSGYTAFCLEITPLLHEGDNTLEVWASNAWRSDVLPISGDFNVQGGIHRPVRLVVTPESCIAPDFYASPGVLLRQKSVDARRAEISVETILLAPGHEAAEYETRITLLDNTGKIIKQQTRPAAATPLADGRHLSSVTMLSVDKPHLWNGLHDPYLYKVEVELLKGGASIDRVSQPLGIRFFSVDREKGFMLNGKPYDLHGYNRHDDFQGCGSALTMKEYRRDMQLVGEAAATVLRLAHYPHGEPIYNLCDTAGVALWTEIPLCGPGGYLFTGYMKDVDDNARQTLREMIYQKMNHPSVMFWGLFNELLISDGTTFQQYDDPRPLIRELNSLAHDIDPTRLTCFATCVDEKEYLGVSDLIAWNKYFSWQKAEEQTAEFFDRARAEAQGQPVGVSEYGKGGSTLQHAEPLAADGQNLPSTFHPEEYQAICHENYWKALRRRPWLWIKTIWQFSDMMSAIKNEGDTPGMNDKGMVAYDRRTMKDAYYFYAANWQTMSEASHRRFAPMLHLCSKGYTNRTHAQTEVRVYTTLPKATLWVNGKRVGERRADSLHRIVWRITLRPGNNEIRVGDGRGCSESAVWNLSGQHISAE